MSYAFQAEGLVKTYRETRALDGVDLVARTGTVLGVLGPNGAGKTTVVRILATLLRPDAGRALVTGLDVQKQAGAVRARIGLTGQYAAVDEMLTGTENLVMIGRLLGLSRADAKARSAELLARFDLTEAGGRAAGTFSGGMRRRLDLASSLVGRPQVLFLDEPTTGLDPHSRNELWEIVRGLVAEGVSVLLTTQYLEEADQLADEIVVIDHGRVIAGGTPEALKAQVGGQVLELRPQRPEQLDTMFGLVAELAGSGTEITANGLVSAPVRDVALMPAVVGRLEQAGLAVGELSLRGSSLDEVFLTLTGHRTAPATAPEARNSTDETEKAGV
jgi:oleandomycin transport system ATP-binding protein